MSVTITDQDRGYAQAVRAVRAMRSSKPWVKIGVSDAPHDPSGTPTDEIGAVHELGLGRPQRSFLRAWTDDAERMAAFSRVAYNVIYPVIFGGASLSEALRTIGSWAVGNVRQRMRLGLQPPLDPKTIDRKVRAENPLPGYPLLTTLQLEDAIIHEESHQ